MNKFDYNARIGIVGYGEIGSSLEAVYSEFTDSIFIKDLDRDDNLTDIDVLNICIPYSEFFVDIVADYINSINPRVTIIHSTVVPKTTKKIIELSNNDMVVHSPVRGIHPKLYDGIKTFIKFIGAENTFAAETVKNHYDTMNIKSEICKNSVTTEIGKLLSTTYYGLCIAWHGEMQTMCKEYGVPFSESVTRFNRTYNEGYASLGKQDVVRPVLYPPGEKIGGHCVIPNAELISTFFSSDAINLILSYSESKNKK